MRNNLVRRLVRGTLCVLTFALVMTAGLPGTPRAAHAEDAKKIEPKAGELLGRVAEFYKNLKSVSVDFETVFKEEAPDNKREQSSLVSITIERPNKVLITRKDGQFTVTSDGKTMWTNFRDMNKYAEEAAPETIQDLTESPIMMGLQNNAAILGLFVENPQENLLENVNEVKYLGEKEENGKKYEAIRFIQDDIDLDLWFAAGKEPALAKVVPDLTRPMAKTPPPVGTKISITMTASNWKFNPTVAQDTFAFKPAEGAQKFDSLMAVFGQEDPNAKFKNKPAADFTLDKLGGGKVKLADHKGKDIVILDFWATWCGPCVQGLPIVTEVSKKYADKNVVFYAMNLREDTAKIQGFLKEHNLDINVALDTDGAIGESYGVNGIPHTVIIGKDGLIKNVHVGFSPNLKKQLSKELDKLLAEKKAS